MADQDIRLEIQAVATSGLFDPEWYRRVYGDALGNEIERLVHFCRVGWRNNMQPNRYFHTWWYLERSPDVAAAGMNPLLHYAAYGEREGRRPMPTFDPAWCRAAYQVPDGQGALQHFLANCATGRVLPSAELYAVPHMSPYRDDAAAGVDPIGHYLDDMQRLGNDPFPDPEVITASGLLDLNYYLINGSDVYDAKLDPAQHFTHFGWREGRKPNIYFDTKWYLQTNPEIARLGIDPLVHYILEGEAANRRPVVYFDPAWYRATYKVKAGQSALAHFLTRRRGQKVSPNPLFDIAWYLEHYGAQVGGNRDPFAHYLHAGTFADLDPSPDFSAAAYRRQHLGRISRQFRHQMHPDKDNPLVHHLNATYR